MIGFYIMGFNIIRIGFWGDRGHMSEASTVDDALRICQMTSWALS